MKVVIDKSFLQGKCSEQLALDQDRFDFVITESLLYEICKTKTRHRKSAARKLLSLPNNVYYTSVAKVLAYEAETSVAFQASQLSPQPPNISLLEDLASNSNLTTEIYRSIETTDRFYQDLYAAYIPHLEAWKNQTIESGISAIRRSSAANFPTHDIDNTWGTYSLIACLRYYAESIFSRYQPKKLYGNPPLRLLHDLIDLDYAVLAIVCGGIATRDKPLINCLKNVCGKNHPEIIQ
ncbi:hypothetical protein H9L17_04810 [Thermomonas brevis]|uniref:Uncharacterized protein n=1 Tax=Thermomonas brevis TaxID=215691 RepID=A0A7G9QVT7_9GAMM|nr:hypothetical protein [Thermomonas brevis]QNN47462.1 hypothetical protein H9L17_04810 [Thermomonas brevis]